MEKHTGLDFKTPNNTEVRAAAKGKVSYVGVTSGCGNTVVVRHSVGATAYCHLERATVAVNADVEAGTPIALSDNSGRSTGPHLHLEYLPGGAFIKGSIREDPTQCLAATVNGSITVSDNGNLKDDAFALYVDGVLIDTTEIGASNNIGVSNLVPGNHTLVIKAVIAPDNIGTAEVRLANGWRFADGTIFKSLELLPGASSPPLTFVVPG